MNKDTNILEIQFKGNFNTTKPIHILYIIGGLILLVPLYFLYFNDWNFYFTPIPEFIFAIIYLIFIGISSSLVFQKIHLQSPITIQVTKEEIFIYKKGKLYYTFSINNLESFSWTEKDERYRTIEIKTSNKKFLKIYTKSIFRGIKDEKLTQWIKAVSNQLKKQLKTTIKSTPYGKEIERFTKPYVPEAASKKIIKMLLFIFTLGIVTVGCTYILMVYVFGDDDPDNKVSSSGIAFDNSNYYLYDNQVYFLDRNGKGYFKVKDADPHTFRPLTKYFQYSTDMAADTFNIFFETKKVNGINRQQMRYIGAYYTADNNNVYYKDSIVLGADVKSFDILAKEKFQSYKFPYGKDEKHVFYKSYLLPHLNPTNAKVFEDVYDYVSDGEYVYYKTQEVKEVEAATFEAARITIPSKLIYAHDNSSFWINGIPFPDKVRNRFIGTTTVDKSTLKLIAKIGEGSYHMIFYDRNNVYYFDESKQAYYFIKKIENIGKLQKITSGVFSIDEDIYFLNSKTKKLKGRTGTRTIAIESELIQLEKTKRSDLQFIKRIRDGIIWHNGTDYLFSYNENETSRSGVYKIDLKKLTEDIHNISYIHGRYLIKISGGKRLFKIKTRPYRKKF